MQILVLGMHRSGTSMVARLLNMMGVYFAPEGVSNGANPENPKGFWERRDVRILNDLVLHSAGADWHRLSSFSLDQVPEPTLAHFKKEAGKITLDMDAYRPWFLKEPRLCILAPLWLRLLEFPVFVFVHRSPLEVARSLEMRNGFPLAFGLALWERYSTAALNATLGRRRIQINHADVMADPVVAARNLAQSLEKLGIRGLRAPSDEEILAFIDPALARAKEKDVSDLQKLSKEQQELRDAFENGEALLATKPIHFSAAAQEVLTQRDLTVDPENKIAGLERRNAELSTELIDLKKRMEQLEVVSARTREALDAARTQLAVKQNEFREKLIETAKGEAELIRRQAKIEATQVALQRRDAEIAKLRKDLAMASNDLRMDRAAVRKLRELLKKSASELDTVRKSSRWKVGSLVLFRPIKTREFEAREKYVGGFDSWKKEREKESTRARESRDPIAATNPPPPRLSFREFEIESVDSITSKLTTPVSIVIPIYNGAEELRRCVDSVLRHTNVAFELVLVDDCSPEPAIAALLEQYQTQGAVRVLRNTQNQGFVRSANTGLRATQHDVVLLNSDTEVTPRWLRKLTVAAYSDSKVATVTPFSNAAGAFSVPELGINAPIPFPFTVLKMARLTERLSNLAYPQVPTGNGFCMYIKRHAIEEIGVFDEENFERGYGEENDFCMRALKAGWRNIIDDSLFIYHRGNSSFGEEKQTLIKRNRETLDRLHPEYTGMVGEFTGSQKINALRSRIGDRLNNGAPDLHLDKQRVLFILHHGSGGVPMTNADLVSKISDTHQSFLLTSTGSEMILSIWEDDHSVEIQRWQLPGTWSAKNYTSPAARRIYFQVLTGLGIDLVHIRHLFKHSFDAPLLCRQLGIPVVLSFHDFYFVCPSVHLLDQNATFCGGQCTPGLEQCTIPSPLLRDLPMLKEYLPEWREKVAEVLQCCDGFVTTADSARDVHLSAYPRLSEKPFWVIEHGRDFKPVASVASAPVSGEPARIVVAGNIDHHKGSRFIRQLKELDSDGTLEFHFLGQTDEELRHIGIHHGAYERDDFARLAREIRPSFAGVFSIWPETYSHTLTEAWSVGLPVLGSKLGAVGERIARHGGGWRVDTADPAAALAQIRQIIDDHTAYQESTQAVERARMQTVEEMADAYRAFYNFVLAKGTRAGSIRIGCIVPSGDRGSTFIRTGLPLMHEEMQQQLFAVRLPARLTRTEMESWIDRLDLHAILVQREALDEEAAIRMVDTCRTKGIRVLFEIDDNLLELEQSHTDFEFYDSKVEAIRYLAKEADKVIVSTPNLLKVFLPLNERTFVVRNTLDEWIWFSPVARSVGLPKPDTIVAGYMGTKTHRADLEMIREPFLRARERLQRDHGIQLVLRLVGGMEEDNSSLGWYERLDVSKGCTVYPRFVRWLRETVSWDFALAPLQMGPLNEAKSALKFLEYAALGVPGIFSRVGEYSEVIENHETGLLADSGNSEQWEELIIEMATSPALRERLATNARRQTRASHLLRNQVPTWMSVLNQT